MMAKTIGCVIGMMLVFISGYVASVSLPPSRLAGGHPVRGQDMRAAQAKDATADEWDPTLQYDYPRLRKRLEAIMAIENDLAFMIAYWELVGATHSNSTILYHGDRAVISREFFLLQDRLANRGWIFLDTEKDVATGEFAKHEVPAKRAVYLLRQDGVVRIAELDLEDIVFITSENAGILAWPKHGTAAVVAAMWPQVDDVRQHQNGDAPDP